MVGSKVALQNGEYKKKKRVNILEPPFLSKGGSATVEALL